MVRIKKPVYSIHNIRAERSSVCMGDDVTAPNASVLSYEADTMLSEFMNTVAAYVPRMKNVVWTVRCGKNVLGYLLFDDDSSYESILSAEDDLVSKLEEKKIFCRYSYGTEAESLRAELKQEEEKKKPRDMIIDGVLAYGVRMGRFVFEKERRTVYVLSQLQHISASDCEMIYQISKEDFRKLLPMSRINRIPNNPVNEEVTEKYCQQFLCGESAYCKRNACTLKDVDISLTDQY